MTLLLQGCCYAVDQGSAHCRTAVLVRVTALPARHAVGGGEGAYRNTLRSSHAATVALSLYPCRDSLRPTGYCQRYLAVHHRAADRELAGTQACSSQWHGVVPRAVWILYRALATGSAPFRCRSEEHTSELQSRPHLVC